MTLRQKSNAKPADYATYDHGAESGCKSLHGPSNAENNGTGEQGASSAKDVPNLSSGDGCYL